MFSPCSVSIDRPEASTCAVFPGGAWCHTREAAIGPVGARRFGAGARAAVFNAGFAAGAAGFGADGPSPHASPCTDATAHAIKRGNLDLTGRFYPYL
jgi:hypothetical protein